MTLMLQTEKREKRKTVQLPANGKTKRVRLSSNGRRFRFGIEVAAGVEWELLGGINIRMETDAD